MQIKHFMRLSQICAFSSDQDIAPSDLYAQAEVFNISFIQFTPSFAFVIPVTITGMTVTGMTSQG